MYTNAMILYGKFCCIPPTCIYRGIHAGIQLQGVIKPRSIACVGKKKTMLSDFCLIIPDNVLHSRGLP